MLYNITMDEATVTKKVRYGWPFKTIFFDTDGSFTGRGPGSWASYYWRHNDWPGECETDLEVYDGILCQPHVQLRRMLFTSVAASGSTLKILQYDDNLISAMSEEELEAYK